MQKNHLLKISKWLVERGDDLSYRTVVIHTYGKYRRTFRKEEKPSVLSDVFALVRTLDPRTRFDDGAAERILTVVSIAVSA